MAQAFNPSTDEQRQADLYWDQSSLKKKKKIQDSQLKIQKKEEEEEEEEPTKFQKL